MAVARSRQCVCSSEMAPFYCPVLSFSLVSLVPEDEAVLNGVSEKTRLPNVGEIAKALLYKVTAGVTRRPGAKLTGPHFITTVLQKVPEGWCREGPENRKDNGKQYRERLIPTLA